MAKEASTKQQILHMLKKEGTLSANEIAQHLKISDIAVRKHLHSLEKDRLIEPRLIRQAMGRPLNVYSLTGDAEKEFPRNYADISLGFLNDLRDLQGEETVDLLFDRREERLKENYGERVRGSSLGQLVEQLARIQDDRGYMAEWHKDEQTGSYMLTEYNCPIHDIAHQYNKACSSELSLFRELLGAEVEQLECKAKGGKKCVYAIKPLPGSDSSAPDGNQ
jgi:predicted ArsR family transcriptional regulator